MSATLATTGRATPPATSVPVNFDNVSKRYPTRDGEIPAVERCTFDLRAGEFVSIVGPSGCGKSTLMLLAAGLVSPTGGAVTIGDTEVHEPYTNLGIIFQDAVLLEWRKVLQNVMLQADIRRLDKTRFEARARELLALVGLDGFEHRYPFELSGGMRQRVSICRGLVHDPPLLLMDEPFGAIDAMTRDQLNVDLESIWMRSPKTVLFITHSIAEAVFLADRVVVMTPRPGRVAEIVDIDLPRPRPLALQDTPEFVQYTHRIRARFEAEGVLHEDLPAQTAQP